MPCSFRSPSPVHVLVFDEKTSAAAKAGVDSALMTMATVTSRSYVATPITSLAVTFLLSMSDVFLIEAQSAATNEQLIKNGETWSLALQEFLKRGGVIVTDGRARVVPTTAPTRSSRRLGCSMPQRDFPSVASNSPWQRRRMAWPPPCPPSIRAASRRSASTSRPPPWWSRTPRPMCRS